MSAPQRAQQKHRRGQGRRECSQVTRRSFPVHWNRLMPVGYTAASVAVSTAHNQSVARLHEKDKQDPSWFDSLGSMFEGCAA